MVIYMPGRDYTALANALTSAGAPADQPCAVVARAGCNDEQVHYTAVAGLRCIAEFASPAVVIVGELARDARQEQVSRVSNAALSERELCSALAVANENIERSTTWQTRT